MIYLLSLVMALLPTYLIRFKIFNIPTTFLELLIVVFLLAACSQLNGESIKKIKNLGRLNWAVGLFVLSGIISTIIGPEKTAALGQLKAFILEPVLFFYAAVITVKSKEDLNIVLRWLFASASLVALFGLIQYVTLVHLPMRFWGYGAEVRRISSVFDYPNALALFLAPLIGFFIALIVCDYKLLKITWIQWLGLGLMGTALILSGSRGALMAVVITLIWLLILKSGFRKTLLVIVAIGSLLLFIPSIRDRISLGLSDPSSMAHAELWQFSVIKISSTPILGNGLAGFATLNQDVNYPHNIFLNFWLELGLLGLISFLAICFFVLERYKKPALSAGRHPSALTFAAGIFMTILILHGLVDVPYFKNDLSVLFWFMISLFYIQD